MKKVKLLLIYTFIVMGALFNDYILIDQIKRSESIHLNEYIETYLSRIRTKLESTLANDFLILKGIATYVSLNPEIDTEKFNKLAQQYMKESLYLKNIALAPNYTIQYVYPLEGNETVLGMNYRNLPNQWKRAHLVELEQRIVIDGPLKLIQGGIGIVGRAPVFVESIENKIFWGLVSSVIDFDKLMVSLNEYADMHHIIFNIKNENREILSGPELSSTMLMVKSFEIDTPDGKWTLNGRLKNEHSYNTYSYLLIHSLVIVTMLLLMYLVYKNNSNILELEKSEKRFRDISMGISDWIWEVNAKGEYTYVSGNVEKVLGYSTHEILGSTPFHLMPTDEKERVGVIFSDIVKHKKSIIDLENWNIAKDGERVCLLTNGVPLIENDQLVGFRGVDKDITEKKNIEIKLQKERALFSQGPVMVWIWGADENWPVQYVSPNVLAVLGYSANEIMSDSFRYAELIHLNDVNRVIEEMTFYIEKNVESFEQSYRLKSKQGVYKWFYDFTMIERDPSGNVTDIRGYMFDQSKLKEIEELLEIERKRLSLIIEGTNSGTWEWNVQTGEVIFNERWAEIIGYTLSELEPLSIDTWMKMAHPDDLVDSETALKKHFDGLSDFYTCETRMKHKDGYWVWVMDKGQVHTWDDQGKPLQMSGTHIDISDIKEKEDQLKRYIKVIDENVITSMTDLDGVITYASQAFCEISGYEKEELIGQNHNIIRHQDMSDALFKEMWTAIRKEEIWNGEIKNLKRDGSFYWVETIIFPVYDSVGIHYGYMAVMHDITAKKELETVSITDRLTGIYNRVKLDEALFSEYQRNKRYGTEYSVILFDIDKFKSVNDTYGHLVGDEVLKTMSRMVNENTRDIDIFGRWGGEEFLIIATNTNLEGALIFAENIRHLIDVYKFKTVGHITCSFGVSSISDYEDNDALMMHADKALYAAKHDGRNCVKKR